MNTYTNVFGGENINQSQLSYKAYGTVAAPLAVDIQLEWPFEALDGANVTASKIDVIANAGHVFRMPDAMLASRGEDILWNNVGANAVTVLDFHGNTLLTVQSGTQWFLYLTDNTTQQGSWRVTQFGAGVSQTNASALAGFGLRANLTKLDQNLLTNFGAGNVTLGASSRAQVFRHTGGIVTYTLTESGLLGNGWFAVIINAGTGALALTPTPPDQIDGAASKVINPGESLTVYSFATGFETMGYGRAASNTVSAVSIDIGGPPPANPIVLNDPQIRAQVQNYTGILTAARIVEYGPAVGYWFIWNSTTGPFTTTFRATSSDAGVVVPQGNFAVLRSDGANLAIAMTTSAGTVTSIATAAGEITGGNPVPITNSGTIGLADMPSPPLTPGTYGTPTKVAQVTVDAKGRTANAVEVDIAIPASAITDLAGVLPPGVMLPFAGIVMPPATTPATTVWLPCDGTTRLKADFPALATALGTAFGPDTPTTFTLPDTRGRVLASADPTGTRLTTAWFFSGANPSVVGAAGGLQFENANIGGKPVGVTASAFMFSPNLFGTINNDVTSDGEVGDGTIGNGTGATVPLPFPGHTHVVRTGGQPVTIGGNNVPVILAGNINVGTRTDDITNVQPTLIIRHIIKT